MQDTSVYVQVLSVLLLPRPEGLQLLPESAQGGILLGSGGRRKELDGAADARVPTGRIQGKASHGYRGLALQNV